MLCSTIALIIAFVCHIGATHTPSGGKNSMLQHFIWFGKIFQLISIDITQWFDLEILMAFYFSSENSSGVSVIGTIITKSKQIDCGLTFALNCSMCQNKHRPNVKACVDVLFWLEAKRFFFGLFRATITLESSTLSLFESWERQEKMNRKNCT